MMRPPARVVLSLLGFFPGAFCLAQSGQTPPPAAQPSADAPPIALSLPKYRNRLLGVYDEVSGEPLEGLEVRDLMSGLSAMTTATGTVGLFFLPEGGSMVRLRKVGYATQTLTIPISAADTVPITVTMSHAVVLPTVTTTGKAQNPVYASGPLRGFEERMTTGIGHYIAYEDIRKNEHMTLADLLRQLGGLTIVTIRGNDYAASTRCSAGLGGKSPRRATVFLDNVKMEAPALNTLLQTTEIAGVEWYAGPAETPEEFNSTGNGCGVCSFCETRVK